jgi:hypothetical protein
VVRNDAGQLKVAVVHGAVWACRGDEAGRDRSVEPAAPYQWPMTRNEPNTPHAVAAGVHCSNTGGFVSNEFFDTGGAIVEVSSQCAEVRELLTDGPSDTDTMRGFSLLKGRLQRREESPGTGDCQSHTAQLAQDTMPGFGGDSSLCGELIKNLA